MTTDAYIGFSRFGLGLRPGDNVTDPRQQMLDEIGNPQVALLEGKRLLDSPASLAAYCEFRMERKASRAELAMKPDDARADAVTDAMAPDAMIDINEMAEPEINPGRLTEFGRTARTNGNEGTDHGTATVAFLLRGAVKGGRVIADWPGYARPIYMKTAI